MIARHPGIKGRGRQKRLSSQRDVVMTRRADFAPEPTRRLAWTRFDGPVFHDDDEEARYYRVHLGVSFLVRFDGPSGIDDALDYTNLLVGIGTNTDYILRNRVEVASQSRIVSVTPCVAEEVTEAEVEKDWP